MAGEAASDRESWRVLQAQSGNREALNELFKSVQDPLFRYIVSLVRDQHLAEDILQEVFIRIYRTLDSFDEGVVADFVRYGMLREWVPDQ